MIARNIEYDGWIKFERKEKIARWKFELNVWTVGKKWSISHPNFLYKEFDGVNAECISSVYQQELSTNSWTQTDTRFRTKLSS